MPNEVDPVFRTTEAASLPRLIRMVPSVDVTDVPNLLLFHVRSAIAIFGPIHSVVG